MNTFSINTSGIPLFFKHDRFGCKTKIPGCYGKFLDKLIRAADINILACVADGLL